MNGKSKDGWEMVGDGQCQTEERCILQLETFYMAYAYILLCLKNIILLRHTLILFLPPPPAPLLTNLEVYRSTR